MTTKPGASLTSTGVLPMLHRQVLDDSPPARRGCCTPAMTSTSFMAGTGLKKCMPMMVMLQSLAPISVMDREEVLEAKMVLVLADGVQLA